MRAMHQCSCACMLLSVVSAFVVVVSAADARVALHTSPAQHDDAETAPTAAPSSDAFYANWMGSMFSLLQNLTLLDLSIPGTHDTMTFDLSTTVSDNANDLPINVSYILHEFHTELEWLEIGNFMRNQSKTQGLSLTEQLNAGIRFIDFRTIYTAAPNATSTAPYDWYGLHFVESKARSILWLAELKQWVDAHPQEVVVIWISKHGDNCGTHYDGVPLEALHAYWAQIRALFGPLLFNHTQDRPLNETSLGTLVGVNQRVVAYVADYDNFTTPGGDDRSVAYTDCLVDNQFSSDSTNATSTVLASRAAFLAAEAYIEQHSKPRNAFYLLSMAGDPSTRLMDATMLRYFNIFFNVTNETEDCARSFHIPGMNEWCPMHLQSSSQLLNYYNQIPLSDVALCTNPATGKRWRYNDESVASGGSDEGGVGTNPFWCPMRLPNAIYIDAVDVNGTVRVGTTLYGPGYPDGWSDAGHDGNGLAAYGYVDTFLLVNLRRACSTVTDAAILQDCTTWEAALLARWHQHPLKRWDDAPFGRQQAWPLV